MYINEISTKKELCELLGTTEKNLNFLLYKLGTENLYHKFQIPKKTGGFRIICAPESRLKTLQKKIAKELWESEIYIRKQYNQITKISHAFEPKYEDHGTYIKKGIFSNAKIHKNKKYVLNIDLEDFFDCFHFGRVKGFFEKNQFFMLPPDISLILTHLVCYEGKLPQGSPTSPIITNLISKIMDNRIWKLSKIFKLDYTRYADDLTFSTNDFNFIDKFEEFFENLENTISDSGFKINHKKTRIQFKNSRQTVTGLVVNKKINVSRDYVKQTKAMAHHLYQGKVPLKDGNPINIYQINGRFAFIDQIEKDNNLLDNKKHNHAMLSNREKEYRKFLFYKNFYAHNKPLIVTEGKTDIDHIKFAIKYFYLKNPSKYGKLIKKNEKNEYEYHISFLNRTKKLKYLLNISQYGGDALNIIYNYYKSANYSIKEQFPNYYKYFFKLSKTKPKNPMILIADNEPNKKGNSPLKTILNKDEAYKLENNNNVLNLKDNIYLLTFPIPDGKTDAEIEDLYSDDILNNTEIDGRFFDREQKNGGYSKAIFAEYIRKNYESIDFSNFEPLIDNLINIIDDYQNKY